MHDGKLLKQFIKESGKTISAFSSEIDMPARATIERDISQEFLPLKKRLLYAYGLRIRVESFSYEKSIQIIRSSDILLGEHIGERRNKNHITCTKTSFCWEQSSFPN